MSEKQKKYDLVLEQLNAVLYGETDTVAQMATVACLLSEAFPETFFWTGFYVVDPNNPNELIVGPYQGSLGCLRITFGRGVCGLAAQEGKTQVVEDVHAHPNHIACDSRSNSEIVVPVRDNKGQLIAVLDVDSEQYAAFDEVDQRALEMLMKTIFVGA